MSVFGRIKEWIMSKLPVQDVYNRMGVKPQVSVNMQDLIDEWRAAYQGSPSWLESRHDKTIGFPSIVTWDIAKKAIGELEISASRPTSKNTQASTDEATEKVIKKSIKPFLRDNVEYALAMGGVIARPWFDQAAGKTRIGWYTAESHVPTAWDGKKMTGVILIDRYVKSSGSTKTYYTKLESIQPVTGGWTITTKLFKNASEGQLGIEVPLTAVPQWAEIEPEVQIISDVCPFAYMGTPWANNKDMNSPQGTSIYRDAMSQLPELDRTYTSLCWEIESGKAAVFIADDMVPSEVGADGKLHDKLNQLERRLYRKVEGGKSGKDLLEKYSPDLRVEQLNAALKTQLSVVCMLCHLDAGAYVYDQAAQAVTATEVRTKQQQTYGTIVDIQDNMIRPFVGDLIDTIRLVQVLYEVKEQIPDDILLGFDFGDSILVDEGTDRMNAQTEVATGLRSKLAYLMDYRGMTEAEALEEIKRITDENPPQQSFFGA
jgi:A118 family predicted phage portal protein